MLINLGKTFKAEQFSQLSGSEQSHECAPGPIATFSPHNNIVTGHYNCSVYQLKITFLWERKTHTTIKHNMCCVVLFFVVSPRCMHLRVTVVVCPFVCVCVPAL